MRICMYSQSITLKPGQEFWSIYVKSTASKKSKVLLKPGRLLFFLNNLVLCFFVAGWSRLRL